MWSFVPVFFHSVQYLQSFFYVVACTSTPFFFIAKQYSNGSYTTFYLFIHQLMMDNCVVFIFFLKIFKIYFQRGEGRERERKRNISVWLPLTCPLLGTWPKTQTCALTRNQTGDPLICRPVLNPLSHSSQSLFSFFDCYG